MNVASHGQAAHRLREGILQRCFGPFEGQLASGAEANNIFDLRRLSKLPELAALAVNQVACIARGLEPLPDAIVPVSNDANWIGRGVSKSLGLSEHPWILDKDSDGRISAKRLAGAFSDTRQLLLVEDMFTSGTNTREVLNLPEIENRAIGVVAIWDRGDSDKRPSLGIPISAVIQEHVPPMLPPESPYWRYLPDAQVL